MYKSIMDYFKKITINQHCQTLGVSLVILPNNKPDVKVLKSKHKIMAYLVTGKRGAYQGACNKDMKYHSNKGNQCLVATFVMKLIMMAWHQLQINV